MNDEAFFNALSSLLNKSVVCNDTRLKGDTDDFDSFYKQLSLLGYGYVVEHSVRYDGKFLTKLAVNFNENRFK